MAVSVALMNSSCSLAEERVLNPSLKFKLGININSELVIFLSWFTPYGEFPMSIYVLLSDEHQVLILHDTKKSDASHPYLCSDEFLNRPGPFGPTASAYKIAICFLLSSANLFYSQNTLCEHHKNCWLCWVSKRSIVFVASLLAKYFLGEPEDTCKFFRSINMSSVLVMLLWQSCTAYIFATVSE